MVAWIRDGSNLGALIQLGLVPVASRGLVPTWGETRHGCMDS